MTNALTNTNAAARGQGHGFARLARRGLAVCMLACVGLGAAHAQGQGRRDEGQLPPPPSARGDRMPQQFDSRYDQRDQQRDGGRDQQRDFQREQQRAMEEQARRQQMQQQDGGRDNRRPGRLTPDERRDLRRQINEAGADIYSNTGRR